MNRRGRADVRTFGPEPCPSWALRAFEVRFADHPIYRPATSRLVRFPSYAESGHMVPLLTESTKLRDDVRQLLDDSNAFE